MANLFLKFVAYLFSFCLVNNVDGVEAVLASDLFVLTSVLPGDIRDGQVSARGKFSLVEIFKKNFFA